MGAAPGVLIRARGLSVRRGGRQVLDGIDLDVRAGEVVVVLGPNGAGKSTLLAALAGLLDPSAGTIERDGRVAAALQAPALARRSARANVEAALAWWGAPSHDRRDRALHALARLRVDHLAERSAATLSGGEGRRVHLARALAVEADIVLLDEPFAGLDAPTRADLLDETGTLLREPGRATLVVVHDRAEAWALADRVVVLLDGRLAGSGPPAEIFERPGTPELARFLGFSGSLEEDGGLRLLRPAHVELAADGPLRGRVVRRVPIEDGMRLELELPRGRLAALAPLPGPAVGEEVAVRVTGGVLYARGG